jgi:anti-sigma B factor antagonist
MQANVVNEDDQAIVQVLGEVDVASAGVLWETLQTAAIAGPRVVVDLSETLFIDSSGLAVLVRAHNQLSTVGGALVLRAPHERVSKVLGIAGLDCYLTIEPAPAPDAEDQLRTPDRGDRQGQE